MVGRVDVRGQESLSLVWVQLESHKEREARRVEESQPWSESLEVFASRNSEMMRMPPSLCKSQKLVGVDPDAMQVMTAAGSYDAGNPWPWPHGWACVGTGCHWD